MRFLACVQSEVTSGKDWASQHEPVIPNFPTGYANSFLGVNSFRPTMRSVVYDFTSLDLDAVAAGLHKQFPGLPKSMLDTYVLETAKVAHQIPLARECNVYIDWDSAKIMDLITGEMYTLWDKQPIPEIR